MNNDLLRHYVATLSYRASKAFKDAPKQYPDFEAGKDVRQPVEILNHMSNVLTYALNSYGEEEESFSELKNWEEEIERFYRIVEKLDQVIAKGTEPHPLTIEQIVQGPLSDVMTHIGQLYTLRRLAGSPVTKESFIKADIRIGKVRYE
ncbi:hypothetical protein ACFOU2_20730 [Bacillus songklensis]|uniref:Damage-inducible protein DinB n=1 Tax=Bacillus songklensis TaxID=1069116 RepID=A0ABV8B8M9_9BACI